jgi:transporter family-2 protein
MTRKATVSLPIITAFLLALAAGVALALQAPVNAFLGRTLGEPGLAAVVSFAGGLVTLVAYCVMTGVGLSGRPFAEVPWWGYLGGIAGAFYMISIITAVPRLGAFTTLAVIAFAQLATSLAMDAGGVFGLEPQPLSWQRLVALALMMGGIVLSRWH